MNEISDVSIILFVVSGIFFAIAIFVFGITICYVQSVSKTKEDRLILLDEVMLVHTDENIDCQSKTTDMKSE